MIIRIAHVLIKPKQPSQFLILLILLVKNKTPNGAITLQPMTTYATFPVMVLENVVLSHPQLNALAEIKRLARNCGVVAGILVLDVRKLIVYHLNIPVIIIDNSAVIINYVNF